MTKPYLEDLYGQGRQRRRRSLARVATQSSLLCGYSTVILTRGNYEIQRLLISHNATGETHRPRWLFRTMTTQKTCCVQEIKSKRIEQKKNEQKPHRNKSKTFYFYFCSICCFIIYLKLSRSSRFKSNMIGRRVSSRIDLMCAVTAFDQSAIEYWIMAEISSAALRVNSELSIIDSAKLMNHSFAHWQAFPIASIPFATKSKDKSNKKILKKNVMKRIWTNRKWKTQHWKRKDKEKREKRRKNWTKGVRSRRLVIIFIEWAC